METLQKELIDKIVLSFNIDDKNNLVLISRIGDGFSGAEVYLIELKGSSRIKGYYFLKIDLENEEYENNQNKFCFSKVAKCIEKRKIDNFYIMLLQIAGKSSREYQSFYSIHQPVIKKNATTRLVAEMLKEAVDGKNFVGDDLSPSVLFKKHLKNKMNPNGALEKYLLLHLSGKGMEEIYTIQIHDKILPNAYAYAINNEPWNSIKFKDMTCCIHGDFHGKNVFVSAMDSDYTMIDMASYRNDGYLFFDMAYFEFSLLAYNMEKQSLAEWLSCIDLITRQDWDNLDCKDSKVIQEIVAGEMAWIELETTDTFNYPDQLRDARLIARVLAGLNYAGKKKVSDELRQKAFFYACYYLKNLLKSKGGQYKETETYKWKDNIRNDELNIEEYNYFLDFSGRFDGNQDYYLVLGECWNYPKVVSESLTRINLSGVISFCKDRSFEEILEKKQFLRYIIPTDEGTWGLIERKNTWWIYADGLNAVPESLSQSVSVWRSKYGDFWFNFHKKISKNISEEDLLFIINWPDFKSNGMRYIEHLFRQLELIAGAEINIAILDPENSCGIDVNEYESLNIRKFDIGLEAVAMFCSQYLAQPSVDCIYIPSRQNRFGEPLDKEIQLYVEKYTVLVHEQLLERENLLSESEKYKFYFGEPITWTAIEEELYVKHNKIKSIKEDICKRLEKADSEPSLISIPHSPGAGASVLGRVICWDLKDEYPVFILENKFDENTYECLLQVSNLSGKPLLIFLDGNYNPNDVKQFVSMLGGKRIKSCVLYPYRVYKTVIENDRMLSALAVREGEKFRKKYETVMIKWKNYDEQERGRRIHNMDKLTSESNLLDFRLPFFYGMHAFEEDYRGIFEYLTEVFKIMKQNEKAKKIINYMALISYYTENKGLGFNYSKKLLEIKNISGRELLKEFQVDFPKMIYIIDSAYRICHPIIAREILKNEFIQFESEAFKEFCIQFIEDLKNCESKITISDRYQDIMMDLFVKRDTEGDIDESDTLKKNFSQVILDIGNPNLQEQIYKKIIEIIPKNQYFHQHYARLIMANNPMRLHEAQEHLDEAIKIDPKNGSLFHSRGNLYIQYVLYQMRNNYKKLNGNELYNKLKAYVDLAIEDLNKAIDIEQPGDNVAELVYPYASIIQISTSFVSQLAIRLGFSENYTNFLEQNNEMSRWSKDLISKAVLCDIDSDNRYALMRKNEFYNKRRYHLAKFQMTSEELEYKISENPKDYSYQVAYLGIINPDKKAWNQKSQEQLKHIIAYCENLMMIEKYRTEGVLWKWFNACIHMKRTTAESYSRMLGLLETMPERYCNVTANYFMYMLYFCQYMETGDEKRVEAMLDCLKVCREFANDKRNKSITHYYYIDQTYTGSDKLPLDFERENAQLFDGTVTKAESNQSGYLTLDKNPRLRAFFVPIHTELKRNQEVGKQVQTKIGFRFDGLSAWDMKIKKENDAN